RCTAQALGRVMGAAVATQRSLWLSLAKLSDREKAPLLDAPVSVQGAFGEAQERCRLIASGLSDAVVATIQSAQAVSTRALYTLKWRSFERWCAARQHDPINCALGVILEFLQQLFDEGKAASTLKVYMAAISA